MVEGFPGRSQARITWIRPPSLTRSGYGYCLASSVAKPIRNRSGSLIAVTFATLEVGALTETALAKGQVK